MKHDITLHPILIAWSSFDYFQVALRSLELKDHQRLEGYEEGAKLHEDLETHLLWIQDAS